MLFNEFKRKIAGYVKAAGGNTPVSFINDTIKGKYIAVFPDGTRISGHPSGLKMTVTFGDHHQMMVNA